MFLNCIYFVFNSIYIFTKWNTDWKKLISCFAGDVTSSSPSQDESTVVQTAETVSEQSHSTTEQSQSTTEQSHSTTEQSQTTFLPDLLQLGQQKQVVQHEECTAPAVKQPQTASNIDVIVDNVTVATAAAVDDQERKESRGSCDSYMSQTSLGTRSMSSPDFLLQVGLLLLLLKGVSHKLKSALKKALRWTI